MRLECAKEVPLNKITGSILIDRMLLEMNNISEKATNEYNSGENLSIQGGNVISYKQFLGERNKRLFQKKIGEFEKLIDQIEGYTIEDFSIENWTCEETSMPQLRIKYSPNLERNTAKIYFLNRKGF